MVFDGRAHLVDLLPVSSAAGDEERIQGPPTVTLRDSLELGTVPSAESNEPPAHAGREPPGFNVAGEPETAAEPTGSAGLSAVTEPATAVDITTWGNVRDEARDPDSTGKFEASRGTFESPADVGSDSIPSAVERPAVSPSESAARDRTPERDPDAVHDSAARPVDDDVVSYDWRKDQRPPPRPGVRWILALSLVVLLVVLAGQALFQFRHAIAASYPQLRPHLVAACATLGCTIDALRRREEITIESHDLQADPAHQGLLILQVTLRNHASHPVAFPHLELEILDAAGQPQARRALAPVDYAGGAADFARGMPANAEWNVKLFLDASSLAARGYNLDLFYP